MVVWRLLRLSRSSPIFHHVVTFGGLGKSPGALGREIALALQFFDGIVRRMNDGSCVRSLPACSWRRFLFHGLGFRRRFPGGSISDIGLDSISYHSLDH